MLIPENPLIYEIHTAAYLHELSQSQGAPITLETIPDSEINRLVELGANAVWLMGIWSRSPAAVQIDASNADLQREFQAILPDYAPSDDIGSAYAVRDYSVDEHFGGNDALLSYRERLSRCGIGLILDFVPNHTASDHTWTRDHPDYYIQADAPTAQTNPDLYTSIDGSYLAKGRDPNSAPWPDVLQVNAFSPDYREASITTLRSIATLCDGVRCDMAMLMLDDVVERTWGDLAGKRQPMTYWQQVCRGVRSENPDFSFIAECYWDTERELINQGFDYCYDKTTYDNLVANDPEGALRHLENTKDIQPHLLHFIENHDEPRAAARLPLAQSLAAGAVAAYLPGASLVHHGQIEGKVVKTPVHLRRGPAEPINPVSREFYQHLYASMQEDAIRTGDWSLVPTESPTVIAFAWKQDTASHLVTVNYSDTPVTTQLTPPTDVPEQTYCDSVSGEKLVTDQNNQLCLSLEPWQVRQVSFKR